MSHQRRREFPRAISLPASLYSSIDWLILTSRHALGSRARKIGQGILTVRFEMPFPIWCTTCPKPTIIGQGVRFNAEKKKVDKYYSTSIFSFRMKHTACGGWIEIRTDPKNTAYVVVDGAKKRDLGEDKFQEGGIIIRTQEEKEKLQNDAFAALEVKIDDRKQAQVDKGRIDELMAAKDRDWDDPYAASRKLRSAFRVDRKIREKKQAMSECLRVKMSLGIDLLEESKDDGHQARLIEFGRAETFGSDIAVEKARAKPLFESDIKLPRGKQSTSKSSPATGGATRGTHGRNLHDQLRGNTRAVVDPFLHDEQVTAGVRGIKRRRPVSNGQSVKLVATNTDDTRISTLVDYDSD